jgi:hypothetical protein
VIEVFQHRARGHDRSRETRDQRLESFDRRAAEREIKWEVGDRTDRHHRGPDGKRNIQGQELGKIRSSSISSTIYLGEVDLLTCSLYFGLLRSISTGG